MLRPEGKANPQLRLERAQPVHHLRLGCPHLRRQGQPDFGGGDDLRLQFGQSAGRQKRHQRRGLRRPALPVANRVGGAAGDEVQL